MNKKYFFFDIDGTLTDKRTGLLVDSAVETIAKLKENGHFVSIATGRAYYKTKDFAKMAGIPHIVSNGGAGITIDYKLIENSPLDFDKAVALCNEAVNKGYGVLVATDDSINVRMINDDFIKQVGYRKEPTRYVLDISLKFEDLNDIYKIYISISKEDENKLELLNSLGHLRFVNEYIMYQHDQKNKGIEKMIELVGGKVEDVVVFGDDYNDMIMFDKKWTSIAMGNACDELKAMADFVTKDNIDDGIKYACEYFNWI